MIVRCGAEPRGRSRPQSRHVGCFGKILEGGPIIKSKPLELPRHWFLLWGSLVVFDPTRKRLRSSAAPDRAKETKGSNG